MTYSASIVKGNSEEDCLLEVGASEALMYPGENLDVPSTPAIYANSLAFLYRSMADAKGDTDFLAVGFLVGIPSEVRSTIHTYFYLVTNEHVIRGRDAVVVRLNSTSGGFRIHAIPTSRFERDAGLDLAIAGLQEDASANFTFAVKGASVMQDDLPRFLIGYGTDVFMPSRLYRPGVSYLQRNISILRFGNIALVPQCEEPFYLVEMRSISGHSGSPVFVYSAPFVLGHARTKEQDFAPMLLGINRGHFQEFADVYVRSSGKISRSSSLHAVTNMAISQVVPAWHIFDMLNRKRFRKQRDKGDSKLQPIVRLVLDRAKS